MSTRSAIGIKHGDRIKAIYCHYDGYTEHVGRALHTYYQSSPKVNGLIAQGDMSSIGANIGDKHPFNDRNEYIDEWIATQCTFYGRDRGEENTGFRSFANETDFLSYYDGCGAEFYYLYDHGVWYVSENYQNNFRPLHEVLNRETANA